MSRSPRLLIAAFVALLSFSAARAAAPFEIPVWPGVAPGSEGKTDAEKWEERGKDGVVDRAVRFVHQPTLTVYLPEKIKATGVAVLLAPGGGFEHVTIDKEGHDVARWLVAQGVAGIVLKYRLPRTPGNVYTNDHALADAAESLKVIRAHASEWSLDPAKVGMMGFSAGGQLVVLTGTKPPKDARPSFLAPMYPVVPENLGGVPADVAPAFIVMANDDPLGAENAVRFFSWMRAQKVSAEIHVFARGGHGFGLGKPDTPTTQWPPLFLAWLKTNKFISAP